ncbi:unnamed protein product [Phytophthora fragariaefolia]|uniref:Unnamed protein product n=1 Tax=Phytophthora fragariaefolia TaxID=1490495 RepID=A0A9W6XMF2_9STRA|nr:unnamed protein product [Phytophthora fragariaefolia]
MPIDTNNVEERDSDQDFTRSESVDQKEPTAVGEDNSTDNRNDDNTHIGAEANILLRTCIHRKLRYENNGCWSEFPLACTYASVLAMFALTIWLHYIGTANYGEIGDCPCAQLSACEKSWSQTSAALPQVPQALHFGRTSPSFSVITPFSHLNEDKNTGF